MTSPLRMASLIWALLLAGNALVGGNVQAQLLVNPLAKPVPETQRDLLAIQSAAMEVAQRVKPCTVGLQLRNAMGSGVVISEDGYILTAAHVVGEPGREMEVLFPDGTKTTAISLGLHTSADGALCKIIEEGRKWPHVSFVEKDQAPKIGDWCIAMGHPGGFDEDRGPPVRVGRVIDSKSTVLRTDCPITSGDSGGPLLDMQGRVIGIHSRITESLTENYHVPATAYREAWDRLVASKLYPQPLPSHFLALMDADKDGLLERDELKTNYFRRVFDRLKEEFDLEGQSFEISELTDDSFKWRKPVRARLVDIEELQELDDVALSSRDFVRGPEMTDLFELSLDNAEKITVRVYCAGRRVALGTIVDEDGFLVTKASQLKAGAIECLMPGGGKIPGQLVATDYDNDLAMIRVQASGLETPEWSRQEMKPGVWVAIPDVGGELSSVRVAGTGTRLTGLGVVGVAPRQIKATPAMLGIQVDSRFINAAVVAQVLPRGGAGEAGMEPGDVVLKVESADVTSVEDIKTTLADFRAGDKVSVVVQRGDDEIKLDVLLRSMSYILFNMDDLRMSGRLSRRRDGFVSVFQMDAAVRPEVCGGPVVDANGKVVGVTIARATRVASYAIPFRDLRPVIRDLRKAAGVRLTNAQKTPEVE